MTTLRPHDEAYDSTGETPVVPEEWEAAAPPPPPPERPDGFIARLRSGGLDLRNTWQVVVGALLLPLGIAVIVLGWNGAAHGRVDQQQIPYLISGGILGLAAVMVGCFFFWAHWLYRIYDQADLHHQEAMQEQSDLIRVLLEAVGSRPVDDDARDGHHPHSHNGSGHTFVATPTGSNFHVSGCPIVAKKTSNLREISAEEARSMRPCRICDPLEN